GVETRGVQIDPASATILKTRVIAEHQQVVRFDRENAHPVAHKIQETILRALPGSIAEADGVILSDYGNGMITQPILRLPIAQSRKAGKPVCVDPKLEHFLSYKNVTCITPNLNEALGGMHRLKLDGNDGLVRLGKDILKAIHCESVLITQGEEGMT